jgi:hypothetical protein
MRPSLKALRSRAGDKAQASAAGSTPPAGQEPPPPIAGHTPGAIERGNMRRRLRRARRMREALLTELGALTMEMHRQRRHDPALLERKAREASVADREVVGLARALDEDQTLGDVVTAGIAGGCRVCRALLATDDRYCARCGTPVAAASNGQVATGEPAMAAAVAAPPPSAGQRVDAPPPPISAQRVDAPPPPAATRVDAPPPDPSRPAGDPPPGVAKVLPPPSPGDRVEKPAS